MSEVGPSARTLRQRVWVWSGRQKYRNIAAHPEVALSVNDPERPYRYLEVRGVVDRVEPDSDARFFLGLAERYGLSPDGPPEDAAERVVVAVRPTGFSSQ